MIAPLLAAAAMMTAGGMPYDKDAKPLARVAKVKQSGRATVPAGVPRKVRVMIRAGNRIATKPYLWGGGHGSFTASGYDCSGSVSYVLHAAGLLDTPLTSGALASWGEPGPGKHVTIYANGGHVYADIAGVAFDTSGANPSRWQGKKGQRGGYTVRHPAGL